MGWAVVVAPPLLALSPLLAFAVATALPLYARFAERRRRRRSAEEVLASVPDTIDLFVLAAGSRPAGAGGGGRRGHPGHRTSGRATSTGRSADRAR